MSTKCTVDYDSEGDQWHVYTDYMDEDKDHLWIALHGDDVDYSAGPRGCSMLITRPVMDAIHAEVERRREQEANWRNPDWIKSRISEYEKDYEEYLQRKSLNKDNPFDAFIYGSYPLHIAEMKDKLKELEDDNS